jgi:hypothetical protein
MKNVLTRFAVITLSTAELIGCSARPIQSATISSAIAEEHAIDVPAIYEHKVQEAESDIAPGELALFNQAAGSPSIGIVKGFYQLPAASPYGATSFERARGLGFDFQKVTLWKDFNDQPYALAPIDAKEAEALSSAMNSLLDANIRLVEVSMADAMKIMEAEKMAMENKTWVFPKSSVPSGVDLLVSVEKGYGYYGNNFVGRVIRTKDGQICAFSTTADVGPASLGRFVSRLVKDCLRRLGAPKQ